MRVLHIIPGVEATDGGPSQVIFPMCRTLNELGIEVTLATTCNGDDLNSARNVSGVDTHFFKSDWGESFKYSRALARWLTKNVKEFDLVHIHAVFNHSSVAAARACFRHGIPYIVRPLGSLDPWGMKQKRWRKFLFWNAYGKSMCSRSAAMHYTASEEKRASERSLGLNHGVVIPLGVQSSSPICNEDIESFQMKKPYVLVLSRLLPAKGIATLTEAFLHVTSTPEFAEWKLIIAGDGPSGFVSALRETTQRSYREESVVFTGWLDTEQKSCVLRNADLLALPSRHENFGLCVLEALAEGVPVLVSPHVGLAEEVALHDAGWVVPVDPDAIASALAEAFRNKQLLLQRAAAAKELSRKFEWTVVGKQLETLYQSLIRNRSAN